MRGLGFHGARATLAEAITLAQASPAVAGAPPKEICPMRLVSTAIVPLLLSGLAVAQTDFQVTGTQIPTNLVRQNYGAIPKGISAFDLNICNVAETKQSLVSSKIYQALTAQGASLDPIGRDIMLAAIIRNQTHTSDEHCEHRVKFDNQYLVPLKRVPVPDTFGLSNGPGARVNDRSAGDQ